MALIWRHPRGAFWLTWILVGLAPVLVFGRFGDVILADRFLYLPSVGAALLCAFAFGRLSRAALRPARALVAVATVMLVAGLATAAAARTRVWKDDLTLFSDMLRRSSDSALVRNNLGLALYERGDLFAAREHFRSAIALAPAYAMAHNNLAAALEQTGEREAAARHYRRALELAPGLLHAECNLGHLLVELGQPDEGLARLGALVRSHPHSVDVLYAAADAALAARDPALALSYVERASAEDPQHAPSHYLAGRIHWEQGSIVRASSSMRRYLELSDGADGVHALAARRVISRARGSVAGEKP
jgi:Tfp pilus assembly protein PilF